MRTNRIKKFGYKNFFFYENVASNPRYFENVPRRSKFSKVIPEGKTIFSFRVDADEICQEDFSDYVDIFAKYKDFITVFLCCSEFEGKEDLILKMQDAGVDIQSHGYYHYVYNDYPNNFHNITKADNFLKSLNINTKGFAGPMGKYTASLGRVLEDKGYKYSSEFSFDYVNFPHYPVLGKSVSKVIQLPIFPICPEILFSCKLSVEDVVEYYQIVIEKLKKLEVPIILYAHTDVRYPQVKKVLNLLLRNIYEDESLMKMTLTDYADWCFSLEEDKMRPETDDNIPAIEYDEFLFGKTIEESVAKRAKCYIKNTLDFEKITPENELKDSSLKKAIKMLMRKML